MHGILARWRSALISVAQAGRRLILFQLWFALIVGAVLSVAMSWLLDRLIRSAGTTAVTNFDLISFFLTATGLITIALIAGAWSAAYFIERCGILILLTESEVEADPIEALRRSLRSAWPLMQLGWWYALVLGGLAIPFAGIALVVARLFIGAHDINFYLYHQPREWWLAVACGAVLVAGYAAVAVAILFRFAFSMQLVLIERLAPRAALAKSWTMTKGRFGSLAMILGGWLLIVLLITTLISAGVVFLGVVLLDATEANPSVALVIVVCFGGLLTLANAAGHLVSLSGEVLLANRLFHEWGGTSLIHRIPARSKPRHYLSAWLTTGLLAIVSVGGLVFAGWRLVSTDLTDEFSITAHRAGAAHAPENTMAALRQAIAEQADLAEIDVQTTRDGELVILHDGDLARIGGDPRRVQDLTLAELRQIDIGRWKNASFTGEHVATLQEMVHAARGRIRLNVELKYNRDDPALAGKVIGLLRAEGVLADCVITSLEYSAVREAKRLAPEVKVGLIVTKVIGDPTGLEVDFLSLNQNAVSSRLIHRAHSQGMEVHVWTVNDLAVMQRMVEIGVDSLITDYPAEAVKLRRDRSALSSPEMLVSRLRNALLGR